jgi:hypothetical protein
LFIIPIFIALSLIGGALGESGTSEYFEGQNFMEIPGHALQTSATGETRAKSC